VSVSVFGDVSRSGSWRARETLVPIAVFGDVDLDVRHAAMVPDEVNVTAVAPFGDVEVIVPNGVELDVSGFTLFGSKKIAVQASAASESALVVRVHAFPVFGSVKVWSA
jgi:predicted membrane protein